jgi:hypothetical protein
MPHNKNFSNGEKARRYMFCKHCGKVVDSQTTKRTDLSYNKEKMGHVSKCSVCHLEDNMLYCRGCNTIIDRRTKAQITSTGHLPVDEKHNTNFEGKEIPVVSFCPHCEEKKVYHGGGAENISTSESILYCRGCDSILETSTKTQIVKTDHHLPVDEKHNTNFEGKKIPVISFCPHCEMTSKLYDAHHASQINASL